LKSAVLSLAVVLASGADAPAEDAFEFRRVALGEAVDDGVVPARDASLDINGFIQFRYVVNSRDPSDPADAEVASGFGVRRLRVSFEGYLGDPSLRYDLTASFERAGTTEFSDATIKKEWEDLGVTLTAGRFKLPFLLEFVQSATRLLAVDRSPVNTVFSLDRSVGLQLAYQPESERFRVRAAFSGGAADDFDSFATETSRWAVTARAEANLLGSGLGRFSTAASDDEAELGWLVGLAGHAEERSGEQGHFYSWTADTQLKGYRWTLQGAAVGSLMVPRDAPDFYDMGFVVQGGAFVAENVEAFVRYDIILPDGDREESDSFSSVTAGLNYYIVGQNLKLSTDVQWFPDALDETFVDPSTGIALLESEGSQLVARVQLQLRF